MSVAALEEGVPWSWHTFGEYLDQLEGNIGVNAGFLVGHCALRRYVMGEAAVGNEATPGQLDDCVESIRAWPGGAWVGHGCGPLLSNPTCARLIVQEVPSGSPADCKVPVAEDAD
jgi:hypothetical protein